MAAAIIAQNDVLDRIREELNLMAAESKKSTARVKRLAALSEQYLGNKERTR